MDIFYGVFYYNMYESVTSSATVYIDGYYRTLNEAKDAILYYIPNPKLGVNHTVEGGGYIAWVNKYNFGPIKRNEYRYNKAIANQPHTSINLFEENY